MEFKNISKRGTGSWEIHSQMREKDIPWYSIRGVQIEIRTCSYEIQEKTWIKYKKIQGEELFPFKKESWNAETHVFSKSRWLKLGCSIWIHNYKRNWP